MMEPMHYVLGWGEGKPLCLCLLVFPAWGVTWQWIISALEQRERSGSTSSAPLNVPLNQGLAQPPRTPPS
jgi:hypothetical protein